MNLRQQLLKVTMKSMVVEGSIQQEDMTIVKVYVLDVMKSIYFKQMLVILNVDICSNMIILGTL